jgi:hypothetical protein
VADGLVPLGSTAWALWPDVAVRGAGFPAARLLELCDDELAAAADTCDVDDPGSGERYREVYCAATGRLSAAIRRVATDDRFREAVTWQNPALVTTCLDRAAAGERRNSDGRGHELTIANHLQRYCLKNDTIGFFGPVGWARLDGDDRGIVATPGPHLVAERHTYFESWAVDAVADTLAAEPLLWPWLRPRVPAYASVTGRTVHLPLRRPVVLTAAEASLVARCDGDRTVWEIVGEPADPRAVAALLRLRDGGVLQVDLSDPLTVRPERELAARIDRIGSPRVRAGVAAALDELLAARDAVACTAGDPAGLACAAQRLDDTFEKITGRAATRRAGGTYAARTIVYQDTVRDIDIRVGRRLTDRLAEPLAPVLDSATWLADALGERSEARVHELLELAGAATGRAEVPLLQLMIGLFPQLTASGAAEGPTFADEVVAEFQLRWRRVLDLPADDGGPVTGASRRHHVTAGAVAERAEQEFAARPRCATARWHSPDIMVLADDAAALARGDVEFVLGEVHCGSNTLETSIFVAQHPEPGRLRAAATASRVGRRVVFVPGRDDPHTTSRTALSGEAMLRDYTFVCTGPESITPPPGATVLAAVDLTVLRRGGDIVVRHRGGAEYGFLDVIGQPLALMSLNAFQPVGGAPHRPRVTIDRLVLAREAWTFPAPGPGWAFLAEEGERYLQARRWRAGHGMPERCFYRVPHERKPLAVDFRSLPLVNSLAKLVRGAAAAGGALSVSEMLPDVDRLWLADGRGDRYTCELRMVAVGGAEAPQ